MVWSVKNVAVIVACIVIVAWFFRYEYVTKTIRDTSCVERIDRFTGDRCLFSDNVPACTKIVAALPCGK